MILAGRGGGRQDSVIAMEVVRASIEMHGLFAENDNYHHSRNQIQAEVEVKAHFISSTPIMPSKTYDEFRKKSQKNA